MAPYLTQYKLTNTKKPVRERWLCNRRDDDSWGFWNGKIVQVLLTLDELGRFGVLEPLEEQNEDLFPVLNDGLPDETKTARRSHRLHQIFTQGKAALDLRGHVLDDAVDKVKALVVVRLGGDKLLKHSEQTRLRGKSMH